MEYRIRLDLPLTPMDGDEITLIAVRATVCGEFSRLPGGDGHFVVEASDGRIYEIAVVDRGNGRRGSQKWREVREVFRDQFEQLPRSSVR